MLKTGAYEQGSVIQDRNEIISDISFIVEGEVDVVVICDNGTEFIIDTLLQGCNFGSLSVLGKASSIFIFKAKTPVTL